MLEPEVFQKQCTVLQKVVVALLGLLSCPAVISGPPPLCSAPIVIQRTGRCASLAPSRYAPAFDTIKVTNLGKQIVRNFYIFSLRGRQGKTLSTVCCIMFNLNWFDDCSFLFLYMYL